MPFSAEATALIVLAACLGPSLSVGNPGRRYQRGREEGQRGQEGEEKRGEGFRRGEKRRVQAAQTDTK